MGACTSEQQHSKRRRKEYSLRSCKNKKRQKASIFQESSEIALKDLGPEEALKCNINSKGSKANIVDFTKPISKKYKPAIPKFVSHYNFSLISAVMLEERLILIDLGLCRILDDEENSYVPFLKRMMCQKISNI